MTEPTDPQPIRASRRRVLSAGVSTAAALLARACGSRSAPPSRQPVVARPADVGIAVGWLPASVQAAARQTLPTKLPGVAVAASQSSSELWWAVTIPPFPVQAAAVNLGPALRQLNFNLSILLPGTTSAFVSQQQKGMSYTLQVMPLGLQPLLVQYNAAAFRAAGVALPRPGWTFAEFERACAALSAALSGGRLRDLHVTTVLYPQSSIGFEGATMSEVTMATSPLLWEAFITGFGGTVVNGTTVDWSDGAAYAGIQKMMEIFRLYGAAEPFVSNSAVRSATPDSPVRQQLEDTRSMAAMQFVTPDQMVPPSPGAAQVPGLAAFPQMPVNPVTPATVLGCQLLYIPNGTPRTPPVGVAGPQAVAALATIRYCEWLYGDAQQALFAEGGIAPVTTAAATSPLWRAYGFGGAGAVLLGYQWPDGSYGVLVRSLSTVLSGFLKDPAGLQTSLRGLSQAVSEQLTQRSSASGSR